MALGIGSLQEQTNRAMTAYAGNQQALDADINKTAKNPRIAPDIAKLAAKSTMDKLLTSLENANLAASMPSPTPTISDQLDSSLRQRLENLINKNAPATQNTMVGNAVATLNNKGGGKGIMGNSPQQGMNVPQPKQTQAAAPPLSQQAIAQRPAQGIMSAPPQQGMPTRMAAGGGVMKYAVGDMVTGDFGASTPEMLANMTQEQLTALANSIGISVTELLANISPVVSKGGNAETVTNLNTGKVTEELTAPKGIETVGPKSTDLMQKQRSDRMDRGQIEQVLGNKEPDSNYRDVYSAERRAAYKKLSPAEQAEYIKKLAAEKRANPPSFPSYERPLDFSGKGRIAENTMNATSKENAGLSSLLPNFILEGDKFFKDRLKRKEANKKRLQEKEAPPTLEATTKYLDQPERPLTDTTGQNSTVVSAVDPAVLARSIEDNAAFEEVLKALQAKRDGMATDGGTGTGTGGGDNEAGVEGLYIPQTQRAVSPDGRLLRKAMVANTDPKKQASDRLAALKASDLYYKRAEKDKRARAAAEQRQKVLDADIAGGGDEFGALLRGLANTGPMQNPSASGARNLENYRTTRKKDLQKRQEAIQDLISTIDKDDTETAKTSDTSAQNTLNRAVNILKDAATFVANLDRTEQSRLNTQSNNRAQAIISGRTADRADSRAILSQKEAEKAAAISRKFEVLLKQEASLQARLDGIAKFKADYAAEIRGSDYYQEQKRIIEANNPGSSKREKAEANIDAANKSIEEDILVIMNYLEAFGTVESIIERQGVVGELINSSADVNIPPLLTGTGGSNNTTISDDARADANASKALGE